MPHLIDPLFDVSYADAIERLETAHAFLVERAAAAIATSSLPASRWGIEAKRLVVDLSAGGRPALIGKLNERFGEVVNMAATIERMIPALRWFSQRQEFQHLRVRECHPSTSDEESGNDLVLVMPNGSVVVRCEVCDVASDRAGSNGKEKKDIRNLGCATAVPPDGLARFVCTAREFARALTSRHRPWSSYAYRYQLVELGDPADTCLLRVIARPAIVNAG
jgi:hypothetical protein